MNLPKRREHVTELKAGDIIRMNTIGKNLSIIYRQFTVFLNRELADSELTATELMYIGSLYDQDGVTQDDLAREFCIDKAATARTIQTLESKGILLRKVDENDRRAKRIYLTPKAEKYKTTKTTTCVFSIGEIAINEATYPASSFPDIGSDVPLFPPSV